MEKRKTKIKLQKENKQKIAVWIDTDLKAKSFHDSVTRNINLSDLVQEALELYFDKSKKEKK